MQQQDPYALTLLFVGLTLLAAVRLLGLTFMVKPALKSNSTVRRHIFLTLLASLMTIIPMALCWSLFGTSPSHIWQGAGALWKFGIAETSIMTCSIATALSLVLLTPVLVVVALIQCASIFRRVRATT